MKENNFKKWIIYNLIFVFLIFLFVFSFWAFNGFDVLGLLLSIILLVAGWLVVPVIIIDLVVGIRLFIYRNRPDEEMRYKHGKAFHIWFIVNLGVILILFLEIPMTLITQNIAAGRDIFANLSKGWMYEIKNWTSFCWQYCLAFIGIIIADIGIGVFYFSKNKEKQETG